MDEIKRNKHGQIICPHNRIKFECKDCGGKGICEHNKRRYTCRDCHGTGVCHHNRIRSKCRDCKGSEICEHGRSRYKCKGCKGSGICEHNKRRDTCIDCKGSAICEHSKRRTNCVECGGGSICEHSRVRTVCRECSGGSICIHDKKRSSCKECGPYKCWARQLYYSAKQRAKKANLDFGLDIDWIIERLKEGCPVLKVPFNTIATKTNKLSATIDKFYPEKGYTKENSFVISHRANSIKSNASTEEVKAVFNWMKKVENKI